MEKTTKKVLVTLGVLAAIGITYGIYRMVKNTKKILSDPDGIKSSDTYKMAQGYASKFPAGAVFTSPNPLDSTQWAISDMDGEFKLKPGEISLSGIILVQTDKKVGDKYKWVRKDAIVKI